MLSPRPQPRGFTLIEILVVISIIVILAALTVPVFNVLTGSRSIDGATNTVSAMLARARGEAIARQRPVGLAVFTDVLRDRTALALVTSPLPWTNNTAYQRGDVISYITTPSSAARAAPTTYYFICHTAHVSSAGDANDGPPPYTGGSPVAGRWTLIPTAGTGYNADAPNPSSAPPRRYGIPKYVSVIPESELMYLPPGVGAQVLNSARSTGSPPQLDRYLHAGVIFFDADGRLAVGTDWGVLYNEADSKTTISTDLVSSRLGLLIQFDANPASSTDSNNLDPVLGSSSDRLRSGLGVLLFDRQAYLSQGFTRWDAQVDPTRTYTGSSPSEQTEEAWLDSNGTLLLLNRYNGTLLRTE